MDLGRKIAERKVPARANQILRNAVETAEREETWDMEREKQENQETAGLTQAESEKHEVKRVDRRHAREERTGKRVAGQVRREQAVPNQREQETAKEGKKYQARERRSERVPRGREERE